MDRNTIETILTALNERRNRLITTHVQEGATLKLRSKIQEVNQAIRKLEAMRNASA